MPITFLPIPETFEEAVQRLASDLTEEELMVISKPNFVALSHHGVGMSIRNQWIHQGGALRDHFVCEYGLGHPDDMSGMLMEALHRRIVGLAFDPDAEARSYQEFWLKQGVDPISQKSMK